MILKQAKPAKPEKLARIRKVPNMLKRLRYDEFNPLQLLADLGTRSDVAVLKNKPADLVHNRAFTEHQQKLFGAIERLAQVRAVRNHDRLLDSPHIAGYGVVATGSARIPARVESAILKSAFKTLDAIEYEPCGKVRRCRLSDGHIGDCRE